MQRTISAVTIAVLLIVACTRQPRVDSGGEVAVNTTPVDARSLPSSATVNVRLSRILLGGAIGAAAGTIISLGVDEVEALLPAGTRMTLQTTRSVALRQSTTVC
jgi:hypothetical protein